MNNRAQATVRHALESLEPLVKVREFDSPRARGLDVRHGSTSTLLVPIWGGEGYPQDVRRALRDLDDLQLDAREFPVIVVRQISKGAQALLNEAGVSWADERGQALVSAPPALLIDRRPAPRTPHRAHKVESAAVAPSEGRATWSQGSGAIAELLLDSVASHRPVEGAVLASLPSGIELAGRLGVSPALISRAMSMFDAMGWTEKSGAERGSTSRRRLVDPAAMLSSWASWHSQRPTPPLLAHATYQDPTRFVQDQVAPNLPAGLWAVTGWLALEERAPFVTSIPRVTVYLDPLLAGSEVRLEEFMSRAGLREVDQGARVALITGDPYVLRSAAPGLTFPLVSDIRLYGDLLQEGVRGPDAAEHLRDTRIGF